MMTRSIGILLILVLITTNYPLASAQQRDIVQTDVGDLATTSSRLWVHTDQTQNIRHFTYLQGPLVDREPEGNAVGKLQHTFKYGQYDVKNDGILFTENVTDKLVYPFHYNFEVDSQGRVHTAFITDNYTLYYAMRDTSGDWSYEQLTQPNYWYAWAPTIALGTDDQPRIVYAISFKENASDYFGIGLGLNSIRSAMYTVKNGGSWKTYDVGENHGLYPDQPSKFYIFNPGISILDGTAYIAFNNRVSLAAESRIYYMAIPEIPDSIVNNATDNFRKYHHRYTIIASTIATTFSRPIMEFVGDGIVIAAGTFTLGGAYITYNNDRFEKPAADKNDAINQWQSEEVELSVRSFETRSVSLVKNSERTILLTYSAYNEYDQLNNRFTHNIFLKQYSFVLDKDLLKELPNEGMQSGGLEKITDNQQIHQAYPNIVEYNSTIEISYFKYETGGNPGLFIQSFKEPIPVNDNSEYAALGLIFILALTIAGILYLITKIERPEEEKEILPHMVNLRDAITED